MAVSQADLRSDKRKLLDEQLAAEPPLPPPELPANSVARPIEEHLRQARKGPVALLGIVENGQVRLLDPQVKLPEHSRVIVVTTHIV